MAVLSEAPSSSIQLPRSGIQELTAGKTLSTLRGWRHSHRHRFAAAWPFLVRQNGPFFHRRRHTERIERIKRRHYTHPAHTLLPGRKAGKGPVRRHATNLPAMLYETLSKGQKELTGRLISKKPFSEVRHPRKNHRFHADSSAFLSSSVRVAWRMQKSPVHCAYEPDIRLHAFSPRNEPSLCRRLHRNLSARFLDAS